MLFAYYDSHDDMPLNQLPEASPPSLTMTSDQMQEELEKVKQIILYDLDWEAKLVPNPCTAATYVQYCEMYSMMPTPVQNKQEGLSTCCWYWPCYSKIYDTKDAEEILRLFPRVEIICTMTPNNQTSANEMLLVFDLFIESTFLMLRTNEHPRWKNSLKTISEMARLWLNEARKNTSSLSHNDAAYTRLLA